tara:strand:- start:7955 stop:8602 length:648 start_codon:yes stop_codon:yes gene_type:complete
MCEPYRLGDAIHFNGTNKNGITKEFANCHKQTIAGQYMSITTLPHDMRALSEVVTERCGKQITPETVVHLRLGDALVPGNTVREKRKPPAPRDLLPIIERIAPADQPTVYLAGVHNKTGLEKNGLYRLTEEYVSDVKKLSAGASVRLNGNPDDDFCRMVNAKTFVAGRGRFSEAAFNVRSYMGRETVQHTKLSGWDNLDGTTSVFTYPRTKRKDD